MHSNDIPVVRQLQVKSEWLSLRREEVLLPDLPIIDAHHHLWDHSGGYFLHDLLDDTGSGHNVLGTVYVQCGYGYRADLPDGFASVGETEFAASVYQESVQRASPTRACAAIVGFADLTLGTLLEDVLQAHIVAGKGRFRGVRHIVARHPSFVGNLLAPPPLHLLREQTFRAGLRVLESLGVLFFAWL
jgi:L-fuconolactonase